MKLLNLHLNTTFSFLESTISIDDAIKKALDNQIDYLVFSEKNHFYSLGEANFKCLKNNIKPIFGLDVSLLVKNEEYSFNLFAKNKEAFKSLKKISYLLLDNNKLELDLILREYKDIIIIENPNNSYYKNTNNLINAKNYFIGLELHEIKEYKSLLEETNNLLVFNNFNILDFEDISILDLLSKINNKKNNLIIKSPLFFNIDNVESQSVDLINKTNEFIKNLYFPFQKSNEFPLKFKNDENLDSVNYLKLLIYKKINQSKKLSALFLDKKYIDRLEKELSIINLLKFEDYFLIVQDWINWAKSNNISIGPGRGSAAGSLICYVLGITEIDPIAYDLIFERFLNPKRVSLPDIDVDVQDDKRYEIIDYLINKYGYDNVNNIVTFSTLGKKSAIRDVLRAYEIAPTKINQISKLISSSDLSLAEEVNANNELAKELSKLNPEDIHFRNKVIFQSSKISGFYRQIGTHAAGIVISSKPIIDLIPISKNLDNFLQTQISMEYLEYFGLVKMDILGLRTLTIIKEIENYIKKNKNISINWEEINYHDKQTFDMLSAGNSIGVFQVESPIMIKALMNIKIDSLNDIAAVISLNRPGPMAYVSNYAKRKFKKEEIPSISTEYDKIVEGTYGIIIYQEQIMQIAQKIADMTYSEADILRKIISKKQASEMEKMQNVFIKKAIENGYKEELAKEIFKQIEKFADYGFNKSHAIAYSMLTFKMAYLKAHYPLEFYTSCISFANGAQSTINKFVNEARSIGINIVSPNINESYDLGVIKDNKIILPLSLIKGIGPEIIKLIIENRKEVGFYKNFLHCFLSLSKIKSFGKATLELLIKANALRDFNLSQATMLAEIDPKSDSSIFIKHNLHKSNEEITDKLSNFNPSNDYDDNEEVIAKNEIELLGQLYNAFPTSKYELDDCRLINTRVNNEYNIVVRCSSVTKEINKFNKIQIKIYFEDSSYKVVSYISKIDNELLGLKNKILKIKFIRREANKISLIDWKVVK